MRELGFTQLWPKLTKPRFTTFRFTRRDKDWYMGETVKVVVQPRSKHNRSILGLAKIVKHEPRWVTWLDKKHPNLDINLAPLVSHAEARVDGFTDRTDMVKWVSTMYGNRILAEPMNRLSLSWEQRWLYHPDQKPHMANQWVKMLDI